MLNFKKSSIILIILTCILVSLSFISASDVSVVNNDDTLKISDISENASLSNDPSSMNITIYSNNIYVSPSGSDSGDGSSANPYKTLNKAVSSASSNTNIYLYDGVYSGSENNNIRITNKNLNFIAIDNTLLTAIDGSGVNRLFNVGGNIELSFVGLTLRNGYATSGGAINVDNSRTVTLINILNCTIANNVASNYGGALYIHGMDGTYSRFLIENSTLFNNYARNDGGAVFVDSCGALSLRHTSLVNNSVNTANGYGGAVYNSYLTWTYGALFENNSAYNGGALYNINGNLYTYYNNGENTIFRTNYAAGSGGAIYKTGQYGLSRINNTLFYNNSALYGGAIALINSTVNITVINSTFAYNTAVREGGAVYNNARSSFYVSYSVLYGNTAPTGNAISSKSSQASAEYNWWGNNTNPTVSGDVSFKVNNYVVMGLDTTDLNDKVQVTAKLKEYYNVDSDTTYPLTEYIPFNFVSFSSDDGFIAPFEATLIGGEYNATYYKGENPSVIYARMGSQTLTSPVPGTGIKLTVNPLNANLGETVNITGTVSVNGESINNGFVSVDTENLVAVNEDGSFNLPVLVNITKSGLHYLPVTYRSSEYETTTTVTEITVGAIPTILTMDDMEGSYGDTVSLNVYVTDNNGNDIDGVAQIHIYGQDTEVNVTNGVGTTQYTITQPVGEYYMTATFTSPGYASSTGQANLIVTREKVTITAEDVNGEAGEEVNLNITVVNRQGNLVSGDIIVNFNNENTTLSLNNGRAVFTTTLPEEEGNYNITITYLEQGDYAETIKIVSAGVGVTNTVLTGENLNYVYGTPHQYEVLLSDVNGAVIVGRHVSLKLTRLSTGASKTYDSVTDFTGYARLTINLGAGEYMVEASYNGELNRFQPSKTTNYITIRNNDSEPQNDTNKTPTTLTTFEFTQYYGDAGYFNGTITYGDNNPIAGQHLSVKLTRVSSGASKTYDVVSDYLGIFAIQINLAPGNYTALCTYDGLQDYAPSASSNTITVLRPIE